jgi:EF-hand domain
MMLLISLISVIFFSLIHFCFQLVFDRFDNDRSGKIDSGEFKEALRSVGCAVPSSVIQIIMSNYTDSTSGRFALNFDNFVEYVFLSFFNVDNWGMGI